MSDNRNNILVSSITKNRTNIYKSPSGHDPLDIKSIKKKYDKKV